MNDHNLDDLIIPNIEPKSSKAKSILTIVALLIVVLIVAIILTSVVLDDKKPDQGLLEANDTEMVSPELTLQNAGKVKEPKAEPKLNEIIEEELNKPVETKKTPVTPDNKPASTVKTDIPAPAEPAVSKSPEPESKRVTIDNTYEQTPEPAQKEKVETVKVPAPVVAAPDVREKPVKKPPVKVNSGTYFIQVGSFSKAPSKRFLSVISNSGFNYKITAPNAKGTKKLLIGPYPDRAAVDVALVRVKDRINKSAFVVKK